MREIVLDTETTGLDPAQGHRVIDIGCVELINHMPTGRTFQVYINPERQMEQEVIDVHGITNEFLKDKPKFNEIVDKFIEFIGSDSKLVIHNAPFDMKFLNAELKQCGRPQLSYDRVIDTLVMARQKYPGSRVNLNDLCKRFNVDLSSRTVHGALVDSELLAQVYLELIGGREPNFALNNHLSVQQKQVSSASTPKTFHEPRNFTVSEEELAAHDEFMKKIPDNLWSEK